MLDTRLLDQVMKDDWRDGDNIFQHETRLIEQRVSRCGIYSGADFCDCGHPFVNHPAKDEYSRKS
jgi:hypothetical protein